MLLVKIIFNAFALSQ